MEWTIDITSWLSNVYLHNISFIIRNDRIYGIYGITDWLRLQGTSGGHFSNLPAQAGYSRLFRAVASWVLNISTDGDSTTSLGKLFQCSTTLPGKRSFLVFLHRIPCVSREDSGSLVFIPYHQIFIHIYKISSEPPFLQAGRSQLFQPVLKRAAPVS